MGAITVTGNAAADAELRFTRNGKACATVNLAENHRRRNGTEWEDDGTTWYRVTLWGADAEAASERIRKGARVTVTGDLRLREYERDGQPRQSLDITATAFGVRDREDRAASAGAAVRGAFPATDPWTGEAPF